MRYRMTTALPSPTSSNSFASPPTVTASLPQTDNEHGVASAALDLDDAALDALIARVEEAREHQLALSPEDLGQLLGALTMLAHVHERLEHSDLTIGKLKKLLGMARSSEKLRDIAKAAKAVAGAGDTDDAEGAAGTGASHGSRGDSKHDSRKSPGKARAKPKPTPPEVHHHKIERLAKGELCPDCARGRVYKYPPSEFTRIRGNALYTAERHVSERLRCNACQSIHTAALPSEVLADGAAGQQYGYSARAIMGIAKCFGGDPFFRQHTVQGLLGVSLPSSTIFDQCEALSTALNPIYRALQVKAAGADLFYIDDTWHRILEAKPVKKQRGNRTVERSGVYASAMLAIVHEAATTADPASAPTRAPDDESAERRIVLFKTNIGHAGEWLEEILKRRPMSLAAPTVMSDALSSNRVTEREIVAASCNAHGRRGFVDVAASYPHEALHALELYKVIWENERHGIESGLDPEARLAYHQAHSSAPMQALNEWCRTSLESMTVESNSTLGTAMRYIIRHYDELTLFLRKPGVPLDNNEVERLIKLICRSRKNSLFHRSEVGAGISDVITSILATCHDSAVNAFDYLVALQRHSDAVRGSPERWLPWNYEEAMAEVCSDPPVLSMNDVAAVA